VLESLLRSVMEGKSRLEELEAEFDALKAKILMSGGMLLNVPLVAAQRNEREKVLQQVKDTLAEIDSIGVQVKDLDTGLLDFPWVDDPEVLLCWKLGEEKIAYWHNTIDGFRGRKPIDERIAKVKRKPM